MISSSVILAPKSPLLTDFVQRQVLLFIVWTPVCYRVHAQLWKGMCSTTPFTNQGHHNLAASSVIVVDVLQLDLFLLIFLTVFDVGL